MKMLLMPSNHYISKEAQLYRERLTLPMHLMSLEV